eukprot:5692373-Prymnesium_polylepis.1
MAQLVQSLSLVRRAGAPPRHWRLAMALAVITAHGQGTKLQGARAPAAAPRGTIAVHCVYRVWNCVFLRAHRVGSRFSVDGVYSKVLSAEHRSTVHRALRSAYRKPDFPNSFRFRPFSRDPDHRYSASAQAECPYRRSVRVSPVAVRPPPPACRRG